MELNTCQQKAFDVFKSTKENIFITGNAGTGKSFLINRIKRELDQDRFPIVASTGAAAILVGGRTFHSFFGLGIMQGGFSAAVFKAKNNDNVIKRIKNIDGIIIDEISMLSGTALDAAETVARLIRGGYEPWGGLRVIVVGDFMQLPPVTTTGVRDWAFNSKAWLSSQFHPVVLKTLMRSQSERYNRILQKVRVGEVDREVKDFMKEKMEQSETKFKDIPYLMPRRDSVENINFEHLEEIDSQLHSFDTVYSVKKDLEKSYQENIKAQLVKQAPIPTILHLKIGALVMVRVNDSDMRYVNGSLGHVTDIKPSSIEVKLVDSDEKVRFGNHSFNYLSANGEIIASAQNFPLNLAYAITIHKSQGCTLDAILCDISKLWEPGQAYVALSRLKDEDGLHLLNWSERSIMADQEVIDFYSGLETLNPKSPPLIDPEVPVSCR